MTMEATFFCERRRKSLLVPPESVWFSLPLAESRVGGGYLRVFCIRIAHIGIRLLSHRHREVSLIIGGRRGCCGAGADALPVARCFSPEVPGTGETVARLFLVLFAFEKERVE
ncbi:hypothetical protein TNCV_4020711 [Trichonephila clavipes]|uniref:Uncharacterized protein n=1 Tax=Trichonephila clavipes TaxID=2585209 RepID=A0A8X6RKI5_TRICX|nr:hypothetical protein TNCV_4020711 [Trichonephila clavipes]